MDKKEFWATKSRQAAFEAISFDHPEFDEPIRLVANQFETVALGGFGHLPVAMQVKPPDLSGDAQPKLTLAFPRQLVGQEFKRKLALITAGGSRHPITVNYDVYLGDTSVPEISWELYASDQSGVTFGNVAVQVTATDDNPMRRAVAPVYDPAVFTGLVLI